MTRFGGSTPRFASVCSSEFAGFIIFFQLRGSCLDVDRAPLRLVHSFFGTTNHDQPEIDRFRVGDGSGIPASSRILTQGGRPDRRSDLVIDLRRQRRGAGSGDINHRDPWLYVESRRPRSKDFSPRSHRRKRLRAAAREKLGRPGDLSDRTSSPSLDRHRAANYYRPEHVSRAQHRRSRRDRGGNFPSNGLQGPIHSSFLPAHEDDCLLTRLGCES